MGTMGKPIGGYVMPASSLPSLIMIVVIIVAALISASAQTQDLDRGKSGAKLFAATCAQCHRSARGLAKGRFSFTLSYYLRQHYTSSPASAETLTAYLQSVDTPRTKSVIRKSRPSAKNASAPRPPASVPGR